MKNNKILNVALKVTTWMLILFPVFMMLFTVITVTTVDKNDRVIFGYKFYIVRTDSMKLNENNKDMDVHFQAGDIVLIKTVKDPTRLQPGEIIAFISMGSENYGETVTHMISRVEYNEDGSVNGYVTYGTATGDEDDAIVDPGFVLGSYAGKLPGVGNFFAYVKTTPGYILCILIPFLLLILYNCANAVRLFRKYKREQMEVMQAEKDQLEAERAENQRMMQELLALKAQLESQTKAGDAPAQPASEAENADAPAQNAEQAAENSDENA